MSEGLNPFEPPRAEWEKGEKATFSSDEFVDASQGTRFANFLIDSVIRTGTVVAAIVILGDNMGITLGLSLGYYLAFEALFGRTPAKWITRTHVIARDGSRPRFTQILGRSFARFVPFEPFSFFGREARGWHDQWSGTRVVSDRRFGG